MRLRLWGYCKKGRQNNNYPVKIGNIMINSSGVCQSPQDILKRKKGQRWDTSEPAAGEK